MTQTVQPSALMACASLLPDGTLPLGDRRAWSHTLADLAAGFLRDGDCSRIVQAGGQSLAAADIEAAMQRLRDAGVKAGNAVVVQVHNDITAVASLLACWLSACCVCPVDPDTPIEVLSTIERESRAAARIRADGQVEMVEREAEVASPQRGLIRLRRPARVTGADLALIVFTSGSSGHPKGVLLTHHNVMMALRSLSAYLQLRKDDRILSIPPLFFDYGLYQLLLTLFEGCGLALNGRQSSVVMLLKQIEELSPTVLPVVPALASGLARMYAAVNKTASGVRLVTNTGGHLSDSTIAELERAFPSARVMPMYGLTECKRALYLDRERYPGRSACVGRAMPGLETIVAVQGERQLRPAQPQEVGELYVRGPSVMQGYHSDGAVGGARIEPGAYRDDNWLATGDLFSADEDGLLYFRGRSKMLIKQGGYCIYPRDIEAKAEEMDGIVTARVVARQEANGDESAVMFIQPAEGADAAARKRLLAQVKSSIPRTLLPREFRIVDEWPATPNGKIDTRALERLVAANVEEKA